MATNSVIKGRGCSEDPKNRFEKVSFYWDEEIDLKEEVSPTVLIPEIAKSILSLNLVEEST